MITQEWNDEEVSAIEAMGFLLNKKGHYASGKNSLKDLTLCKRLDAEFNETFYQAYDSLKGLVINIAINHIKNSLLNLIESIKAETEESFNFDNLIEILSNKNIKIEVVQENNKEVLKINNQVIRTFTEWENELDIVYCVLNYLKSTNIL
jgi:hypothetical protein